MPKTRAPSRSNAKFDQKKEVRAIARERVGAVKPSHPIEPKDRRNKPKYKKPIPSEEE